jgi:cation:H+ antiporter
MFNSLCLFAFGILLLIKGGDWFVDGASNIAKRFHLPELLIGATVVSIGTTLPEVMVSSIAAAGGSGDIAYGNALGSIICNTALIAAVTISVKPGRADRSTMILPVSFFFGAMAFYAAVSYTLGEFPRYVGFCLLGAFVVYMVLTVLQMKKNPVTAETPELPSEQEAVDGTWIKDVLFLVFGAAVIALGAILVKDNAEFIAAEIGIPASVIGITVVAIGTSLPELVTAITSLLKGHGALSLGNIIGANLFNLVLVSGAAVTISPFSLPSAMTVGGINSSLVIDIPVAVGVMLILTVPTMIRGKLSRAQGIALLAIYAAFTASQFVLAAV